MTLTSKDLAELGVDPLVIAFRRWRREHRLSIAEAARLMDLRPETLQRHELGIHRHSPVIEIPQRMQALMSYWRESMRAACTLPKRRRGRKPKLKPLAKCEGQSE